MRDDLGFFDIAEYAQLRLKATELLDRCLTDGDEAQLQAFVEQQIAHQPPRLQLLREVADDVQLRHLSLREHRFDVRDRIVRLFMDYGADITDLAPPAALDQYHCLDADALLARVRQQGRPLSAQEEALLRKAVEASLETAAQLSADIALTERLYRYLLDWLGALNSQEARCRTPDGRFEMGYIQ